MTLQRVLDDVRLARDRVRGTLDVDPSIVPTLPQLEQCFRDAQGNRSAGPDGIPDEFFAIFARQLVRLYGPLFYKALLRLDVPVQFAGGILHELPKGSGAADILDNWRYIVCSNSSGKRLHRVLRSQ